MGYVMLGMGMHGWDMYISHCMCTLHALCNAVLHWRSSRELSHGKRVIPLEGLNILAIHGQHCRAGHWCTRLGVSFLFACRANEGLQLHWRRRRCGCAAANRGGCWVLPISRIEVRCRPCGQPVLQGVDLLGSSTQCLRRRRRRWWW